MSNNLSDLLPRSRLTNRFSYRPVNAAYAGGGTTKTWCQLWQLEQVPVMVRLVFFNDQLTPTGTLGPVAIAVSSEINDGVNPVNQAGAADNTLWQQVTFNNAGADIDYEAQSSGSTTTFVVPAASLANQPTLYYSDWIMIAPGNNAPIDGTFGAILMTRAFANGVPQRLSSIGGLNGLYNVPRVLSAYSATGDFANVGGTLTISTPGSLLGDIAPLGIDYVAAKVGTTIYADGDSVLAGYDPNAQISPFSLRAQILLSSQGFPCSFLNDGYSGRVTSDFFANAYKVLTGKNPPNVFLLQAYSDNDMNAVSAGSYQATLDSMLARASSLIGIAKRAGCGIIVCTPVPSRYSGSSAAAQEPYRQQAVARIKAMANSDIQILDLNGILGTGSTPNNSYIPAYDSGDHIHPGDVGRQAIAAVLAPMILKVCGNLR